MPASTHCLRVAQETPSLRVFRGPAAAEFHRHTGNTPVSGNPPAPVPPLPAAAVACRRRIPEGPSRAAREFPAPSEHSFFGMYRLHCSAMQCYSYHLAGCHWLIPAGRSGGPTGPGLQRRPRAAREAGARHRRAASRHPQQSTGPSWSSTEPVRPPENPARGRRNTASESGPAPGPRPLRSRCRSPARPGPRRCCSGGRNSPRLAASFRLPSRGAPLRVAQRTGRGAARPARDVVHSVVRV